MTKYRVYLFLLIYVLLSVCSHAQNGADSLFRCRLDSLLVKDFNDTIPGGAVLVQIRDKVLYQRSFGLADLKTKEKFTEKTVSNLGSITKTFVAYGILKLRDEGKLSLDDSIVKYFPDFKNNEVARKVKIKHLMTHTSGLPDSRQVEKDSIFYLTANDEQNFAPLKQTDSLEFQPATKWNYSNPAYNGLALIIEKVSGMKWQKFIEQNIFNPAGMSDSKITDGSYPSEGVAHGYIWANGKYIEYDYGEYPTFDAAGNGGVWSSVDDLRKYYAAMKNATFLSKETIEFSHTLWQPENWNDTIPPLNGFSWFVYEKNGSRKDFHHKIVEHSGAQAGFTAIFTMIPEKDVLIIEEFNGKGEGNSDNRTYRLKIYQLLVEMGFI